MSSTRTYTVVGMTCEHCVASVREELGASGGVDCRGRAAGGAITVPAPDSKTTPSRGRREAGWRSHWRSRRERLRPPRRRRARRAADRRA